MAKLAVIVTCGEPRMSWCDECLTSSRYEVDLFIIGASGLTTLGTARGCERCGPDAVPDTDGQE